jgi:hypothetical protein
MVVHIDESELHRTAKIFMDSGQAASYEAAIAKLETFGLNILVGSDVARSAAHQTALLTLVNLTRRSLLGGVLVAGLPDAPSYSPMAPGVLATLPRLPPLWRGGSPGRGGAEA